MKFLRIDSPIGILVEEFLSLNLLHAFVATNVSVEVMALVLDGDAFDVDLAAIKEAPFLVHSEIPGIFQAVKFLCDQVLVDLAVGRTTGDERNLFLAKLLDAFRRHVTGVEDGELRVDPHCLEFLDRSGKGGGIDDVARHVSHVDRHAGSLLDNVNQTNFFRDLAIVIAYGRNRKSDAVGDACAVDQDVRVLGYSRTKPFKVRLEESAQGVFSPDGMEHVADALAR